MERFKGIIALDIDGTITVEKDRLDKKVNGYLNFLIDEGWRLIFITGRTFSFASPVLSKLRGSYFFAVQNGAALYEMPDAHLIKKYPLPLALLPKLDAILGELLIESGREQEDICYYKPASFTPASLDYIHFRIKISPEKWVAVDSFADLPICEFAVGKYFATEKRAYSLAEQIRQIASLNVTVIRDPFRPGFNLALINEEHASKGGILEEFRKMHSPLLPAIGAGDDFNDVEMLKKSTFKIVMKNAPQEMHPLADLVAAEARDHGIIDALKEAIWLHGRGDKD